MQQAETNLVRGIASELDGLLAIELDTHEYDRARALINALIGALFNCQTFQKQLKHSGNDRDAVESYLEDV
jgi:hypothetical protein